MPKPKNPALLQRRNKSTTKATLPSQADSEGNQIPELPKLARKWVWHPMVVAWWADVWQSPMASEYLKADIRGLYRLARLEQDFWKATSASGRRYVSAEIRQLGLAYGLSPIDRRRLQWEVEKGESAAARTSKRREPVADPADDPRENLKMAS